MRKLKLFLVLLLITSAQVIIAQSTITGIVTGSEDGNPIPGATVLVKGTTAGVITNLDGHYSLKVPGEGKILQFSFVGMVTKEVTIGTQTTINVVLDPDVMDLEGVVVTAMGVSREKKALGYATQAVKSEDLSRSGSSSFATALQGKVSGVEIKPSSGAPGASSQIIIRGARSFTGNNTPLYIIDGMPVSSTAEFTTGNSTSGADIANRAVDIDPNDIESINVLKGQAASAIYGIRASNGVIIITTKSGKGKPIGRPSIAFTNYTSFETISRVPEFQKTYAAGDYGVFASITANAWGPKIVDLPNDPVVGGNSQGHPGMYYVKQLDQAGLDPWVKPQAYNNYKDFFLVGSTVNTSFSISQTNEKGNITFGIGNTTQKGIVPSTGMKRWNAKVAGETKLGNAWNMGFTSNFATNKIEKLPGGNDATLQGVIGAPPSYDLNGLPYCLPTDPYVQIYYRSFTGYDNPYWSAYNNRFDENTDRFFGNGYVEYTPSIGDNMTLKTRAQIGMDAYTTHYQDIFEFGHASKAGSIDNYGVSANTINSLITINYSWNITKDFKFNAMIGNEFNHKNRKTFENYGTNFNFGGWAHIANAKMVQGFEDQSQNRTVGFFTNIALDYKGLVYLNATGRNDYVSTMPRGNRSYFYPSISAGFVLSELEAIKNIDNLSFAKVRASYAQVGQAGVYTDNYFDVPGYGGGFWNGAPIQWPVDGISSYYSYPIQYDPKLVPQNTVSYELGAELMFFNNRIGIDYSYSHQLVTDQIFSVPLAATTGASSLVMNGGNITTTAHEIVLNITPIESRNFKWDMNFNFSKMKNIVNELADGVESISLGGFVTPQVRAGIGTTFPVIYGTAFARDDKGNIIVNDNPESPRYGMPMAGAPKVIGEVSPDFNLGLNNKISYKDFILTATLDWKQGGQMYHGSNGLMDAYGTSKNTEENREGTFIYPGVKPDGTPNDIVRGGPDDPTAYNYLVANVLTSVAEYFVQDNSFLKLREVALSYRLPKKIINSCSLDLSIYARNILLWTELPNFDPEASQGNNNMGGAFERFSMPQTRSYGFGVNLNF